MTEGLAFWLLVLICMVIFIFWERSKEPPRSSRLESDPETASRKRRYTRKRPVPIEKHAEARAKTRTTRPASTARRRTKRKTTSAKKKGFSWQFPFWR